MLNVKENEYNFFFHQKFILVPQKASLFRTHTENRAEIDTARILNATNGRALTMCCSVRIPLVSCEMPNRHDPEYGREWIYWNRDILSRNKSSFKKKVFNKTILSERTTSKFKYNWNRNGSAYRRQKFISDHGVKMRLEREPTNMINNGRTREVQQNPYVWEEK